MWHGDYPVASDRHSMLKERLSIREIKELDQNHVIQRSLVSVEKERSGLSSLSLVERKSHSAVIACLSSSCLSRFRHPSAQYNSQRERFRAELEGRFRRPVRKRRHL